MNLPVSPAGSTAHRGLGFSALLLLAAAAVSSCAPAPTSSQGFVVSSMSSGPITTPPHEACESIPILGNKVAVFDDLEADYFARKLQELPAIVDSE